MGDLSGPLQMELYLDHLTCLRLALEVIEHDMVAPWLEHDPLTCRYRQPRDLLHRGESTMIDLGMDLGLPRELGRNGEELVILQTIVCDRQVEGRHIASHWLSDRRVRESDLLDRAPTYEAREIMCPISLSGAEGVDHSCGIISLEGDHLRGVSDDIIGLSPTLDESRG